MISLNIQHRRGDKALQRPLPECLRPSEILLLQPGDVVSIGPAHVQVQLPTRAESLIKPQDFLQS
jgi:hypothetical protein